MSRLTLDTTALTWISFTGLSPSMAGLPRPFFYPYESRMWSEPRSARTSVWALPVSLAATSGITFVFSSSGYLDVSVHRVPFIYLWIQYMIHEVFSCRFPYSEIYGSMDICS